MTHLDLGFNYALTALPPEFGNLFNLTELDLSYNTLITLPPEFGNLSNLTKLFIESNPLQGEIPFFLTKLTQLNTFTFNTTQWCVPATGPIREWLDNIPIVGRNGLTCAYPPAELNLGLLPEVYAHIGISSTATATPWGSAIPITFTWDNGSIPPITHVRNELNDTSWLYWDVPATHTLTVTAANELGTVTATQSIFVHPVSSTVVLPDTPARLIYTDTHGSPTTLEIPAGSVTQTAAILYRPQPDPAPIPAWRPAEHNFDIGLYRDGFPVPDPTFSNPLTLTLHYTDTDLAGIDRPAGLQLMRHTPDGWHPAACGPVSHDLEQHSLSLPLCGLGTFALFGPATLTKFVTPTTRIQNGATLTYTLVLSDPEGSALRIFDPLTPTLKWQGFVASPPSSITFTQNALSGTLTLPPTHTLSISFTVRTQLPDTAFVGHRATISNTAFFCPADETACILQPSNSVSSHIFIPTHIFLPLVLRNH